MSPIINMKDVITQGFNISDGYHTFAELYEHRIAIFMALCRRICKTEGSNEVWRSKLHSDGTKFDGWFVLGINIEHGEQITYHLPMSKWKSCNWPKIITYEKAPFYDGHTSRDVLKRLNNL